MTAFFFRDILRKDIIGVERYDNLQLFRIPHTAPVYGGFTRKQRDSRLLSKLYADCVRRVFMGDGGKENMKQKSQS